MQFFLFRVAGNPREAGLPPYFRCSAVRLVAERMRFQPGAQVGQAGPPEVGVIVINPRPVTITTELPGRTAPYLIAEILRPQVAGNTFWTVSFRRRR